MIKRMPNLGETWKNYLRTLGANAGFVEGLIYQYLEDPSQVDERWRQAFDLVARGNPPSGMARPAASDKAIQPPVSSLELRGAGLLEGGEALGESDKDRGDLKGVAAKIAMNMEASLSIPTATSQRLIPVKLIDENRSLINQYLDLVGAGRISYTHLIGWALIKALRSFPGLNSAYIREGGVLRKVNYPNVNLGFAVDVERKGGQRVLLVPNVKHAEAMNFREYVEVANEIFIKARTGKAGIDDFQGTTVTLTNPGFVGTVSSLPRLMPGQGIIVATGAIEYPAEYHGMNPETLTTLGISKVMTVSCTYDHRIIQGVESGLFLAKIQSLLLGEEDFYEQVFADLKIPYRPLRWSPDRNPALLGLGPYREETEKQARVLQLINAYRVRGHLIADLNPLGNEPLYHYELDPANYGLTIWDLDRRFITGGLSAALGDAPTPTATLREILATLQQTYCGKIGVEYMNIQHPEQKSWLQMQMEPKRNNWPLPPEVRRRILLMLTAAETFETFLHARFIGHKRFSCEGAETIISILRELLEMAAKHRVIEVVIGMAHRARLNVLANIIAKPITQILSEFEGNVDPNSIEGSGDVKYHLGASGVYLSQEGKRITVTVAPNPSHLESVDPVVEGIVRAKQNRHQAKDEGTIMPVLIHGDAAFAGQGIVAETFNLSQLPGYGTEGTIHLIINNQIGFTTEPEEARSTPYSTDVARMVQAPIFHVNGDDPEAAIRALSVAFDYRQRFKRDVVIDMLCYRRYGHNEADDPSFTQPLLYRKIQQHLPAPKLYAQKLVRDGTLTAEEVDLIRGQQVAKLEAAFEEMKKQVDRFVPVEMSAVQPEALESVSSLTPTGVNKDLLAQITMALTTFPKDFRLHRKLADFIERRRRAVNGDGPIDWAFAEALAFGTLLVEGTPVRLSGQDSSRGTFSQRHLILFDEFQGSEYIPLRHLTPGQASFEVYDSLLSEEAVLGFEFGFSVADPLTLVLWEAQFGDFANNAQVIIDQFIVGAEAKWQQPCGLVLLLPHGYEGQGPEHSSARMERYLQLCAENNLQVCNCTTAAQYFHLLRRQMRGGINGHGIRKPLIVFTPKSLLRHPRAMSNLAGLAEGHFREVVNQTEHIAKEKVLKVILCTGKICYELEQACRERQVDDLAILKVEQLYPFPRNHIQKELRKYPNAEEWVWVQEEPQNMGAWTFFKDRLVSLTKTPLPLRYAGRPESASTATGSLKIHLKEQAAILRAAISGSLMKTRT